MFYSDALYELIIFCIRGNNDCCLLAGGESGPLGWYDLSAEGELESRFYKDSAVTMQHTGPKFHYLGILWSLLS